MVAAKDSVKTKGPIRRNRHQDTGSSGCGRLSDLKWQGFEDARYDVEQNGCLMKKHERSEPQVTGVVRSDSVMDIVEE
jgi:hypothetical protein